MNGNTLTNIFASINSFESITGNSFFDAIVKFIFGFLGIDIIMDSVNKGAPIPAQGYVQLVFSSLTLILGLLSIHKFVYLLIAIFAKPKTYPEAPKDKRYAFIITAWNEEKVIANLIKCIREQDYPQELIEIFVVADNCTDNTGKIAEENGAHVYYHFDPNQRSKGYGLHYLVGEMSKTIDIENDFYAYTTLDADNVPAPDYISKLNNYLQYSNVDECICYRNSKNLSENWIAAMCGIQAYSHSLTGLRAREALNIQQEIYGPSTTFRSHVLAKFGWKWTDLCEDMEMLIDLTAAGYKCGYTEEAVFYEEQPNTLKLLWRQRIRWAKGGLIAFLQEGPGLLKSMFKKPSWSKYDIFMQTFPYSLSVFWLGFLYQLTSIILFLCAGPSGYYNWASFGSYVGSLFLGAYISGFVIDLIVIIREREHFLLPLGKTLAYIFLFPLYNIVDPLFSALTPFIKGSWGHIDHHFVESGTTLREQEKSKSKKKSDR